jgi:type IV pilus assembly protein PilO
MDIELKDPRFIRWTLSILVILVVVPVFFMTTILPVTYASRKIEINTLDARHQELSRDLEKARLMVRSLDRVEKEYDILRHQWVVAQILLPDQNEMPKLLRKVTAAGQQSGVEFHLFRPEVPIQRGFYMDNPVGIKVRGGYHQTGVFLSRIANLSRIVNATDMKIAGIDTDDDKPYTVEAELKLTAYTLENGRGAIQPENANPLAEQTPVNSSAGSH